ncbi:dihydrofolate reductase [Episyrphus balteatus]|uniref:dihydrofolate reductase n=1 Tax=Episyrphus balteatus TaxID=286459 RepID=UPI00248623DB|nr:dihydrofolate reductase [Episyrphus balteatus]
MLKFSLIVAVCKNFGIGIKGDLPWHLKQELKHFSRTTKKINDSNKKNVVIMGRKTYFGVPESKRPLPDRINIVLTRNPVPSDYPESVILCSSLEQAMKRLEEDNDLKSVIENVWIVGGSEVYKEAMASPRCDRLYLTEVDATFECDAFFPEIPSDFKEIPLDDDMAKGVQEENGIQYVYKILKKQHESTNGNN